MMVQETCCLLAIVLLQRDRASFLKALMWLPAHNAALPPSG